MNNNKTVNRNYGIDLLRIVSMFMIVVIHIINNGAIPQNIGLFEPRYCPEYILGLMSICAVNCYALVSGYVGYGRKVKYTNLVVLWLRVLFYSVLITLVIYLFVDKTFNIYKMEFGKSFFPVIRGSYWYFTAYFFMFIFTPLLNIALENMNRTQLKTLICIVLIFASVLPIIMNSTYINDPFRMSNGYSALWLMILYIVGGYIKKYNVFNNYKPLDALICYITFVAGAFLFDYLTQYLLNGIFNFKIVLNFLYRYTPIFTVGSSVSLLIFFKNIRIKSGFSKVIGFVSPLVFSVYLIHTNPLIFYRHIAGKLTFLSQMPMWKEIPCIFALAIAIFVACIIIDIPREYLFKKLKLKERIYKIEEKITTKIKSRDEKSCNI